MTLVGVFGLLHSLSFASVLNEIRVPSGDILSTLLGFNLGVEPDQILFIGVLTSALMISKYLLATRPAWRDRALAMVCVVAIYLMGSVGAYWMINCGLVLFEATFGGIY